MELQPEPQPTRLLIRESLVPSAVPLGHALPVLPEPADPEMGWTVDEDGGWE